VPIHYAEWISAACHSSECFGAFGRMWKGDLKSLSLMFEELTPTGALLLSFVGDVDLPSLLLYF